MRRGWHAQWCGLSRRSVSRVSGSLSRSEKRKREDIGPSGESCLDIFLGQAGFNKFSIFD